MLASQSPVSGSCHQCAPENLQDCLNPSVLSLQQISGWLKSPMRTRTWEFQSSGLSYYFFLLRRSIVDRCCNRNHVGLPANLHPQAFSWFLTQGQAELHALQQLSHIKGNSKGKSSISPSCSVFPKEPVSIYHSTLFLQAVSPHFLDPSEVIAL